MQANGFAWVLTLGLASHTLWACDFCDPLGRPIRNDLETADAVIVVRLAGQAGGSGRPNAKSQKTVLVDIVRRYKSSPLVAGDDRLEVFAPGVMRKDKMYLLVGNGEAPLRWQAPIEADEAALVYLGNLDKVAAEAAERLAFFLPYLDSASPLIADDAYNEFAIASNDEVRQLKPAINRAHLISRLRDPNLSARLRRLYFALLGIAGGRDDAEFVQAELRNRPDKPEPMLDAAVACFLSLSGESGLKWIEQEFLADPKPAELPAVIRAFRYHGDDELTIPPLALARSLRRLLAKPNFAEQILVDLARWKDWEALPEVAALLTGSETSALRLNVIAYVVACPAAEAKPILARLEKAYPKEVEFARIRFAPPDE